MVFALLLAVLLIGCRINVIPPGQEYVEARNLLRGERFELASRKVDDGIRRARSGGDAQLTWRFRLLNVEILLGQRLAGRALKALDTYGEPPNGSEWDEVRGRDFLLRGQAAYTLNRFADASVFLSRASDTTHSAALSAELLLRTGTLFAMQSHFEQAETALHDALDASETLHDQYLEARVTSNIGFTLHAESRYDEAIPWFERSEALSLRLGAPESVARADGNLGACYASLGDYDNAKLHYDRAQAAFARSGNRFEQQIFLGNSGNVSHFAGDSSAAVDAYAHALVIARQIPSPVWTARWLNNLATESVVLGNWDAAAKYNDEALSLKRSLGDTRSEPASFINSAAIAAGRGDMGEARRSFLEALRLKSEDPSVFLEAHAGLANLFTREGDPNNAESEFKTAIGEIDRRGSTLLKDEYRFSWRDSLIGFYRQYVDFLVAQNQPRRALEIAESSRSRVLADPGGSTHASEGTSQQYQRLARRTNATLLEFWLGANQSYLWVITPERTAFHTLPPKSVVRPLLASYSAVIASGRNPLDVANETGRRLYDALIAPAVADVPGKTRFIIVRDEDLYSFNFESLPSSDPSKFWIEQATIAIAPSLNYLAAGARSVAPHGTAKLLLVGDPAPALPQYPRLEYASREMDAIAATVETGSATVLKGAGARPDAYASIQPGRFRFIHFAAHASANRVSPLDSAVILSGPPDKCRLLARDVMAIPLNAELVTVSACRSAGGKAYAGEGLVGFAWAFLKAGAGNVIAGLWDVNDRSTCDLMSRLYSEIAAGSPISDALRTSKLALIRQGGAWAKPFYWAPFQLYTGSARM